MEGKMRRLESKGLTAGRRGAGREERWFAKEDRREGGNSMMWTERGGNAEML
jgi:hypothetical protein